MCDHQMTHLDSTTYPLVKVVCNNCEAELIAVLDNEQEEE